MIKANVGNSRCNPLCSYSVSARHYFRTTEALVTRMRHNGLPHSADKIELKIVRVMCENKLMYPQLYCTCYKLTGN